MPALGQVRAHAGQGDVALQHRRVHEAGGVTDPLARRRRTPSCPRDRDVVLGRDQPGRRCTWRGSRTSRPSAPSSSSARCPRRAPARIALRPMNGPVVVVDALEHPSAARARAASTGARRSRPTGWRRSRRGSAAARPRCAPSAARSARTGACRVRAPASNRRSHTSSASPASQNQTSNPRSPVKPVREIVTGDVADLGRACGRSRRASLTSGASWREHGARPRALDRQRSRTGR